MPTIRLAALADAPAIAQVHVASWRTTYRGIVPDAVLDNLSLERREQYARAILSDPDSQEFIYVAEDESGQIIGIASGGPTREDNPIYRGELYIIYLLQAAQGQGIGRMLVTAVAQHLAQRHVQHMLVWVLAANPACRFYEALGGVYLREKIITIGDKPLREIAYGYASLPVLIDDRVKK